MANGQIVDLECEVDGDDDVSNVLLFICSSAVGTGGSGFDRGWKPG
jgi:hypothetical protein